MPVFECTLCGRLLYKPEKLPGRDWHCFTCGPTTVSEEPVSVSLELAALLEKEYWFDLADLRAIAATVPDTEQVSPRRQLAKEDPKFARVSGGVALIACLLGAVLSASIPGFSPDLRVFLGIGFGCLALALGMLLVLGVQEVYRQRWLNAAQSHLEDTSAPTNDGSPVDTDIRVERRDESAGAEPAPKDTASTHVQEKEGDTP